MTRLILPAIFLVALPFLCKAQGVTASADSGRNEPPLSCSTCAGALWQNTNAIDQPDNIYAETNLMPYLFCFQTLCYRSRYLVCSDFGIEIPVDGNMTGILVSVVGKSDFNMMVRDSTFRLAKAGNMVGSNKADTTAWPDNPTLRAYGGVNDTWGTSWSTDEISDEDFGLYLKVYNDGDSSPVFSVDHVAITVFFTTPQGNYSITATPKKFTTVYDPSSLSLLVDFIPGTTGQDHVLEIADMRGQVLFVKKLPGLDRFNDAISGFNLMPGIYFIRFRTSEHQHVIRFPVVE